MPISLGKSLIIGCGIGIIISISYALIDGWVTSWALFTATFFSFGACSSIWILHKKGKVKSTFSALMSGILGVAVVFILGMAFIAIIVLNFIT